MISKIDSLISQMTIEEKVGQMTQISIETFLEHPEDDHKPTLPFTIITGKLREAVVKYGVGSILNVGTAAHTKEKWHDIIKTIQDIATTETRLKIPILYGIDSIHGANYVANTTLFPQQLALAATWNLQHSEKMGAVSAYETKASSIPWNFSPVLDLGKNPVWPRLWETFGEDVHLSSEMGKAAVKGYQGDDIGHPEKVAACLKHFTGYGMPISGKDRTPAWIPERYIQEYYIPAFAAAIDAGAKTIMINSGEVNGIPTHADYHLLTEILREQLGFKGVAVTDWEDIQFLHTRHRIAATHKEAVRLAIEAGVDMSMVPFEFSFADHLVELVKEGTITEERLDLSVRRILTLKMELNLFEQPYNDPKNYPDFASPSFQEANLKAAEESIVLLKNKNAILPLPKTAKVLVVGPTADSMQSLNGGWTYTWQGEKTNTIASNKQTILQAIQGNIGANNVTYVQGASFDRIIDMPAVIKAAEHNDYVVLCLGETSYTEFEGNIHDLNLEEAQLSLAKTIFEKTKKPIILVLLEGRPRIIRTIEKMTEAVLVGFLPGNKGGEAISNILFGDCNPSGKLPITYPRSANDFVNYDHKYSEAQTPIGGKMYYPQYEFGQGLSYTTFQYSDLKLSHKNLQEGETLNISVKITNLGKRSGKEVVQLYSSDLFASITPSVKRLRAFEKIELAPKESKVVSFNLTLQDLAFVNTDNQWITEKGEFKISAGKLSQNFFFV